MNNIEEFESAYNTYVERDVGTPVEKFKHPVPGVTYKYQHANDMLAFWNAARAGLISQLEAAQKERDEATQRLIRYSMSAGEADQHMCESRAVRDELGFEKDADDVAPIDLRNAIVAIRERAESAEAALSAANEKHGWIKCSDQMPDPNIVIEPAPAEPLKRCAAARDGECHHAECPQLRDNEPKATGRHCPIDNWDDE
ncbi:hypothetical protein [Yersinia kristensenii]|nr:hypothetical protein [Yersinia kristensenii]CNG27559.1 Uncharacterised protein [Yersinia kristensenii]CNJ69279.1 Uncharacterised protein [Yersinia kristensenii]